MSGSSVNSLALRAESDLISLTSLSLTLIKHGPCLVAADLSSGHKLQTELVRHLANTLPSIAVQTGRLRRNRSGQGLGIPVDLCALKTPVIFIDMRERPSLKGLAYSPVISASQGPRTQEQPSLNALNRKDMIQKARDWQDTFRKDLVRYMPTRLRSTNVSPLTHSLADAVYRG